MRQIFIFLMLIFLINSCYIQLNGNSFYTVQGKLLDTLNHPIENHLLQVITSQGDLFTPHENVLLNEVKTGKNGVFQMNFPGSSGMTYLTFEDRYFKYDSISDTGHHYGYTETIYLEPNNYNNLYDLGVIHIKK